MTSELLISTTCVCSVLLLGALRNDIRSIYIHAYSDPNIRGVKSEGVNVLLPGAFGYGGE